MGSKKHKKHHKSEKRDVSFDERQEKPLKLVLKMTGSSSSIQAPTPPAPVLSPVAQAPVPEQSKPPRLEEQKTGGDKSSSGGHSHEKHKKSKKKKKKKSTDKDKDRHDRKRKHHHHHHHHREHSHERKEKRRREQQDLSRSVIETHDDSLQKTALLDSHAISCEKPLRDPRTCTLQKKTLKTPLQILLYYILKKLQLKDPQEFFAWPVTDAIAPGYSSIILNPTDFSTIRKRIDDRDFKAVPDFKSDVKLMCDNAMTYNRADTVYYKSARKMLHAAQKLMCRDSVMSLKRNLPHMMDLTVEELGFDIRDETEESLPGTEIATEPSVTMMPEAKKSKVAPSWNFLEADDEDDELTPEDILAEAQKAAKAAAEKLTLQRPNCKFGFLRQHENGSTTLSILHPKIGDKEMKVNLEMLTGKLNQGTGTIIGYKEDSKNLIKPASYANYNTYSSYVPHYDSMYGNLSKEESDLVLSAYGDELGVQYADSISSFVKDSEYAMTIADNILDVLTGGEHSRTIKLLEERKKIKEEEEKVRSSEYSLLPTEHKCKELLPPANHAETDRLQILEEIDMEISLLEPVDGEIGSKRKADGEKTVNRNERLTAHKLLTQRKAIQQKLDNATQLLQDLRKVQSERLSSTPPSHLSLVPGPTVAETELADKVTKNLADIASQLPPESIANVETIRKAMGITFHPTTRSESLSTEQSLSSGKPETVTVNDAKEDGHPDMPKLGPTSPIRASSEGKLPPADMDSDLRQFLETGPMLRVCESPTGS